MADMTVNILGLPELRAKLEGMNAAIAGPAVAAGLMAGAKVLETAAKQNAPVVTGNLRRSIHSEQLGALEAAVGTDVVYARRVEYGFNGPDALGRVYHQPPRPYMRPAFDENKDKAADVARAAIIDVIDAAGAL